LLFLTQKTIPPNTELCISYGSEDSLWFNPIYAPVASTSTSAFIPHPPGSKPSSILSSSFDSQDAFGSLLNMDEELLAQDESDELRERKLARNADPEGGRRRRSRRMLKEQKLLGEDASSSRASSGELLLDEDDDQEERISRSTTISSTASSPPLPPSTNGVIPDPLDPLAQPVASTSALSSLPPSHPAAASLASSSSSSARSASSSSSSTSSFHIHPSSDPSITLPTLPPPLCKPSTTSVLSHKIVLPPNLTDPATYIPSEEIDQLVLWQDLPFKLIRAEGDEAEQREREEVEDGWDTFEIWAVDVEGAGKLTRDVLDFVMDTNSGGLKAFDEKTKHLKRVRKSEAVARGGSIGGESFHFHFGTDCDVPSSLSSSLDPS